MLGRTAWVGRHGRDGWLGDGWLGDGWLGDGGLGWEERLGEKMAWRQQVHENESTSKCGYVGMRVILLLLPPLPFSPLTLWALTMALR